MKVVIEEDSRGFLFRKGKFVKMLGPGVYRPFGSSRIDVASVGSGKVEVKGRDVRLFSEDAGFRAQTLEMTSNNGEVLLHFVDGVFYDILPAGRHFFWKIGREHTFLRLDLSRTEFPEDFPSYLYAHPLLSRYVCKVEVSEKQKALLYFDKKFVRLLDAGTYYFVNGLTRIETETVDTCLLQQDVVGQEILTADKVALRINCTCSYRIADYVKVITETENYRAQLHTAVQLALREFVEGRRLDEILAGKSEMSDFLSQRLRAKGGELYLKIEEAAVKDIILPGEIRDIMNTVLVAEKRAQANVITRREEVASTRSLLNTARLMDENETLYKLKELEYIEKICEKVGTSTLNGNADLLTQLTSVLYGKKKGE